MDGGTKLSKESMYSGVAASIVGTVMDVGSR
jgi:hypothetical protein